MKWSDTGSSGCRYGVVAGNIWGDWDVLWEQFDDDYQGYASFVAHKDGRFVVYDWSYGSCSGCDDWEARRLSEAEMRSEAVEYDLDGMAALVAKTPNAPWVPSVLPFLHVP